MPKPGPETKPPISNGYAITLCPTRSKGSTTRHRATSSSNSINTGSPPFWHTYRSDKRPNGSDTSSSHSICGRHQSIQNEGKLDSVCAIHRRSCRDAFLSRHLSKCSWCLISTNSNPIKGRACHVGRRFVRAASMQGTKQALFWPRIAIPPFHLAV